MRVFSLELKDVDRSWTRQQWKEISRWKRIVANLVDREIDWNKVNRSIVDAMVTGVGVYTP
jgi:hypothetical protein